MNVKQVGNNILFYLKEQGKTQVDLAEALGSSKQVINKIIKGTKALKTTELVAISQYLNVSMDEIVSLEKSKVEHEVEAVHLLGEIKKKETAKFILSLVYNLSIMEEELASHGLLK